MKKINLLSYEIIGLFIEALLGILFHFTYTWLHQNSFIGLFSAINESTWEHLKLIFFPSLFITFIGWKIYKKDYPNYLCAKTESIFISLAFLVIFFYTFKGIFGSFPVINILSFFLALIILEICFFKKINNNSYCSKVCLFILFLFIFLFFLFTFYPPHIPLFQDPLTKTYGRTKVKQTN